MDDELHAAAFVEEALKDDVLLSGDEADTIAFGADVANDLFGGFGREVAFVGEPADGVVLRGKWVLRSSYECRRTSGKGRCLRGAVGRDASPRRLYAGAVLIASGVCWHSIV
jgi:hypothetical protein